MKLLLENTTAAVDIALLCRCAPAHADGSRLSDGWDAGEVKQRAALQEILPVVIEALRHAELRQRRTFTMDEA